MSQLDTFLGRLGRLFKRGKSTGEESGDHAELDVSSGEPRTALMLETHPSVLRPWKSQTAAIARLQEGFTSLTDLMQSIREHMDQQGKRQDELIKHLSTLPQLLEMIPESNRQHSQTLKAIQTQLVYEAEQQRTLADILAKMHTGDGEHARLLNGVKQGVETLSEQDRKMAESLSTVSTAMQSVSQHASASTAVLGQLHEQLQKRDGELERTLRQQSNRFTAMLAIAIFLGLSAMTAVGVMLYLTALAHH